MNFIKAHWKMLLIGIIVIVHLIYIGSTITTKSKVYNMIVDALRTDQSKVVKTLEQELSKSELEIAELQRSRLQLQKDKAALQLRADQSSARISQLQGEVDALNKKYANYIPSSDPSDLINSIRNKGISTIRLR